MKSRSRHSISIRFAYVLDMRSSRLWRGRDRIAEIWDASWAQLCFDVGANVLEAGGVVSELYGIPRKTVSKPYQHRVRLLLKPYRMSTPLREILRNLPLKSRISGP